MQVTSVSETKRFGLYLEDSGSVGIDVHLFHFHSWISLRSIPTLILPNDTNKQIYSKMYLLISDYHRMILTCSN